MVERKQNPARCGVLFAFRSESDYWVRRRLANPRPAKPMPRRASTPGSGRIAVAARVHELVRTYAETGAPSEHAGFGDGRGISDCNRPAASLIDVEYHCSRNT